MGHLRPRAGPRPSSSPASRDDDEDFVIEHDGEVVGYIQAVEEDEPDFRHAGIDLFLRTDAQGRGLGPDAIRTLAATSSTTAATIA